MKSPVSVEGEQHLGAQEEFALACDLGAIKSADRLTHFARAERLLSEALQERQELTDGYALRYHAEEYADLVAFIGNERLCCPFFRFTLELAPAQGPIWLRISGGDGVKEYFRSLFDGEQKVRRI